MFCENQSEEMVATDGLRSKLLERGLWVRVEGVFFFVAGEFNPSCNRLPCNR
jgi:hypothetical protein